MRSWLLWVVVVGACGLPVPPNADHDDDLRSDDDDNCPDVANPDQSDFDGDGTGDACDVCDDGGPEDLDHDGIPDGCDGCIGNGIDVDMDGIDDACDDNACVPVANDTDNDGDGVPDSCDPCKLGPQHDEDNDGTPDACDNCPSVVNPDQINIGDKTQSDSIGDACDAFPGTSDTAVFLPFVAADPFWYLQGSGITVGNDALRIASSDLDAFVLLPDTLYGNHVEVRTRMTPSGPALSGASTEQGILLADGNIQPAATSIACYVRDDATIGPTIQLVVTVQKGSTSFGPSPPAGPPPWNLVLNYDPSSGSLVCQTDGGNVTVVRNVDPLTVAYVAGVFAVNTAVAFNYLWVLD